MTAKEKVKNDVLLGMESHVDKQTLVILERVLNQTLSGVEVSESETLPATTDDSNAYVWKLFMLRKAPKLSERTVQRYGDVLKHFTGYCNKSFFKVTSMDVEVYLDTISKDNCDTSLDGQRRCLSALRGGSVQDAGDYIGHKDNSVTARFYAFKGKDHTEEIFRKYVAIV